MNKLLIATLASSLLLFTSGIAGAQTARARIADAPIRGEANLSSPIIATLKEGGLVDVVDLQGDWYRVLVPNEQAKPRVGYVLVHLMEIIKTDGSPQSIPAPPTSRAVQPIAQGPPIPPTAAQLPQLREKNQIEATQQVSTVAPPVSRLNEQRAWVGPGPRNQFGIKQTLTGLDKADAVRIGTNEKGKLTGLSLTDSGRSFGNALVAASNRYAATNGTGFSLRVYTPMTWVEQLAADAAKQYRPFTVSDITDEMLDPVLRVIVYPDKPTTLSGQGMRNASSAEHVVLRDGNKRLVVQPISKEPFTDTVSSALRDMAYEGILTLGGHPKPAIDGHLKTGHHTT